MLASKQLIIKLHYIKCMSILNVSDLHKIMYKVFRKLKVACKSNVYSKVLVFKTNCEVLRG